MSWSDTFDLQNRLDAALSQYQWNAASEVCNELIQRVHREHTPYPEPAARQVLDALRKKRQFTLAARVAETFVRFGQTAPRIRRQYAQALIDQGILLSPEPVLEALTAETLQGDDANEIAEAHGLLGRLYKQLYVQADNPSNPYARAFFNRAVQEYLHTYQLNPARNSWHGINAVALLHRGKEDGIDVQPPPDADAVARAVLESLPEPAKVVYAFDAATRLEALLALGRKEEELQRAAVDYVEHPEADAFEIGSTLRQLEEVWRLKLETPPGATILPLLRAAKLRREGGSIDTPPEKVRREIAAVQSAAVRLERTLGEDKTVTLRWYKEGLERTASVARIDRRNGEGHGTGWVVRSNDFFPNDVFPDGPRLLLLTNAHVVNQEGTGLALPPDEVRANFEVLDCEFEFEPRIVWSSSELDATFLAFRNGGPAVDPLPLFDKKVKMTIPAARVYIIGHPGGRTLHLSLNDNDLLGCSDSLLHYRAPTEPGSSGSPVFEAVDWRVVALHHSGGTFDRLDGTQPPYEANEGITIRAIKAAIAAAPPAQF